MWYTNVKFSEMCDMYFMYTVESKAKCTEIFKDVKNVESVAKVMRVLQRSGPIRDLSSHHTRLQVQTTNQLANSNGQDQSETFLVATLDFRYRQPTN